MPYHTISLEKKKKLKSYFNITFQFLEKKIFKKNKK